LRCGFGGSLEEVEGLRRFADDRFWGFFQLVGDLEDAWGVGREGGDVSGDVVPVDTCGAGPEVIVFSAEIVVDVKLGNARLEELEGLVDAFVGFGCSEMRVANVEGDADAVEVADLENFEEVLGGGDLVLEIFKQDADAEGVREGFEVLDGGEGVFEGAEVPGVVFVAEVKGTGGDGDLLGGLEGTLDLVHSGDATGLFGIDEVEVGRDVAGPLGVGAVAEVEGLMERCSYAGRVEPGRDVADGSAVGVVEVVAGGEELDNLSAGSVESVEQAGVQALREEDVGRESGLHHLLRYSREAA
jgi:hypothetical protein